MYMLVDSVTIPISIHALCEEGDFRAHILDSM